MPAHRVLFRYHDVDDPRFFNDQLAGFIPEGVHRGYTCEIGSSPENVSIRPGQIMTRKGESIFLDTALANYFRADTLNEIPANAGANPRNDLVVLEFVYTETWPDQPEPIYHILEGADEADFTLPTYNQYQTPIAIGRCPVGQQTYDLLVPFPERWIRNAVYDHVAGVWKIVDGAVMAARIQFIGKDFSELTGWEPGLRIELIAPGTLADDAEIEESDWQLVADYGIGGERVVAEAITELHRLVDLHLWDDVIQRGVVAGGRVTNDGANGVNIAPITIVTRDGYRVEKGTTTSSLLVPLNTDSTNARMDIIAARHAHTPPGPVPGISFEVEQGTPASDPPPFPSIPSDAIVTAWGYLEPGMQQYTHILQANRVWYSNCYAADDHQIHIIDGALGAFYFEIQPNTNAFFGLVPQLKVYFNAGGVADDAVVTMTKIWELNANGVIANVAEVVTARGSKSSLDARLDVVLNEDGTLKTDVVGQPQMQDNSVGTPELINESVDRDKIKTADVTGKHLDAAVAGTALGITTGLGHANALFVKPDNTSLETSLINDWIQVKARGILSGHIGLEEVKEENVEDGAITEDKHGTESVTDPKIGIGAVATRHLGQRQVALNEADATQTINDTATARVKFATQVIQDMNAFYATVAGSTGSPLRWRFTQNWDKPGRLSYYRISVYLRVSGTWSASGTMIVKTVVHDDSAASDSSREITRKVSSGGAEIDGLTGTTIVKLDVNDYVEIEIENNSGFNFTPSSDCYVCIEEI